jgi:predicted transcriptional regulator
MTAVLLSLRPRFSNAILDGSKTVELRRRFPNVLPSTRVFMYSSTPIRAIVGSFEIEQVLTGGVDQVWDRHGSRTTLSREEYDAYFADTASAVAIELRRPVRVHRHIPLNLFRKALHIDVPQSYRYLSPLQASLLDALSDPSEGTTSPLSQVSIFRMA